MQLWTLRDTNYVPSWCDGENATIHVLNAPNIAAKNYKNQLRNENSDVWFAQRCIRGLTRSEKWYYYLFPPWYLSFILQRKKQYTQFSSCIWWARRQSGLKFTSMFWATKRRKRWQIQFLWTKPACSKLAHWLESSSLSTGKKERKPFKKYLSKLTTLVSYLWAS